MNNELILQRKITETVHKYLNGNLSYTEIAFQTGITLLDVYVSAQQKFIPLTEDEQKAFNSHPFFAVKFHNANANANKITKTTGKDQVGTKLGLSWD